MRLTLGNGSAIELCTCGIPGKHELILSMLHFHAGTSTVQRELAVQMQADEATQLAGALIAFANGGKDVPGVIDDVIRMAEELRR